LIDAGVDLIALLFMLHRWMSLKRIERLRGGIGGARKDRNETKLK
jgi:hypothetical protein